MNRTLAAACLGVVIVVAMTSSPRAAPGYDVREKSIAQLESDLDSGRVTAVALVRAYLRRIAQIDRKGPTLQSVIAVNPDALADARASDRRRKAGKTLGPVEGIPILVKDNIETADPMPTTAGSLALKDNLTRRDAPVIARLRAAGAIILGKTNLSEWANIRSSASISGWSAVGGLTRNPYVLDRNPCGSSAGSGTAVAASLAAAAIGTETDGSITCPASIDGIVGLKPTVGLVSRTHIVPISHSQDTAGPMGRTVADVASLLTAMAGSDKDDPATAEADAHKTDYAAALKGATLKGERLGVVRLDGPQAQTDPLLDNALKAMRKAGAEIVEIKGFEPPKGLGDLELKVLVTELKADLNTYLATSPAKIGVRSLADVIAFDKRNPRELSLFGQDLFESAEKTKGLDDPEYVKARNEARAAARKAIDTLLAKNRLDAIVMVTAGPSWRIDVVRGDNASGSSAFLPAVAGYPHLTVPTGYVQGLPVGLSFIGTAWSEARLLALGAAFEQATHARKPPTFLPSLEATPAVARAFVPDHS